MMTLIYPSFSISQSDKSISNKFILFIFASFSSFFHNNLFLFGLLLLLLLLLSRWLLAYVWGISTNTNDKSLISFLFLCGWGTFFFDTNKIKCNGRIKKKHKENLSHSLGKFYRQIIFLLIYLIFILLFFCAV